MALEGYHLYFSARAAEHRENSEKLMNFQNLRGGTIVLDDIPKPRVNLPRNDGSAVSSLKKALEIEKTVNQEYLNLLALAEDQSKWIDLIVFYLY